MANIREASAPADLGLRPDDRAGDSVANAGRRIAGLYGQAGDAIMSEGRSIAGAVTDVGTVAEKYMEHREISQGIADSATALSTLDQKWNQTVSKADPNDPSVAAKFKEEVVDPTLEKLGSSFMTEGGQKYAEATVEKFRSHFVEKTSADMAELAKKAVSQNIETLKNQLSNMAITDPSSLRSALDIADHSVGAMVDSSPNLKGVNAAAMKLELVGDTQKAIVKAAAIGAINANPEAGLKQFSSPEYSKYISGAELKQLEQQAKTVERAKRVDENYLLQNQKLEKQDASDNREGQYLQKLHSDDPQEKASVSAKAIASDFTLTREARERMIGIVDRATKEEAPAKISNATATDLISRIRAPAGDPNRVDSLDPVYDAYEKGKLSKSDLKFVRDEFTNLRTPEGAALGAQQDEFIKSVKPLIDKSNPLLGKIDQSGPQQVYNFTMDLRRKVDEYRKAGKDPRDLMDPSKPDYMGTPAALLGYQKPLQQSLADTAASLRGTPAAAAPPSATSPPANLRGIASLSYSAARKQFRDDATGKVYGADGTEVK